MANTNKKPLFHKAIMESGASIARVVYPYNSALHQKRFEEFLLETGSSDISEDHIMPHLRTLPVSTIVSASEAVLVTVVVLIIVRSKLILVVDSSASR
jgi:hypothetical protein